MNQLYLFILLSLLLSIPCLGQKNGVLISGEVMNDTIAVENVHVINKNSNKGSVSNKLGQFKISVNDKDTLIISDIQYQNKIIIINQDHLLKKFIIINLMELTNELDEVIVMQYDDMLLNEGQSGCRVRLLITDSWMGSRTDPEIAPAGTFLFLNWLMQRSRVVLSFISK